MGRRSIIQNEERIPPTLRMVGGPADGWPSTYNRGRHKAMTFNEMRSPEIKPYSTRYQSVSQKPNSKKKNTAYRKSTFYSPGRYLERRKSTFPTSKSAQFNSKYIPTAIKNLFILRRLSKWVMCTVRQTAAHLVAALADRLRQAGPTGACSPPLRAWAILHTIEGRAERAPPFLTLFHPIR